MNIVALTGRLTADTNVKYTQSGKAVCTFDIAVDDGFGDNKQTYFHRIVVWGKSAESCGNNLSTHQAADNKVSCRMNLPHHEKNKSNDQEINYS